MQRDGPAYVVRNMDGTGSNVQVVSISLAGAAIGSLSGTVLADSLGRIKTFALDSLPLIIGAAICATSTSANAILLGRFLVGVGIGLSSALVPLYISEVAPTSARGQLGTINQLIICIGILGALVANVVLPVTAWRSMFWLAAVPAALLAVGAILKMYLTPCSYGQLPTARTVVVCHWSISCIDLFFDTIKPCLWFVSHFVSSCAACLLVVWFLRNCALAFMPIHVAHVISTCKGWCM
jgi:MFS family permease